jgi:hypothetical protein
MKSSLVVSDRALEAGLAHAREAAGMPPIAGHVFHHL